MEEAQHAYRTAPNGNITPAGDLGTMGGLDSRASGVNASGQVVGYAEIANGDNHAFRTTAGGNISAASDLGTLGGTLSQAFAINDLGQCVGFSLYPGDNFFPGNVNDVGFVDRGAGNVRLNTNSAYRGKSTDGRDLGVDLSAIAAARAGRTRPIGGGH